MDNPAEKSESGEKDVQPRPETMGDSQTASDFIESQLQLEADAREALPYSFESCSQPLGPLRQTLFACLTCSPPPASEAQVYTPAGICYSCSIACHGDHTLVELFSRRDFVCDCGSTRVSSPCTLRREADSSTKGVHSQPARKGNHYNHNFQNKFCGCQEEYNADLEKGTMFQCLGLGTVESGGCGEDWWHPECLLGLPRTSHRPDSDEQTQTPKGEEQVDKADELADVAAPPGFPSEDDFDTLICCKCVESNPWIKQYAGTTGFLAPLHKGPTAQPPVEPTSLRATHLNEKTDEALPISKKRKASEEPESGQSSPAKRVKDDSDQSKEATEAPAEQKSGPVKQKHELLPAAPPGIYSLLLKEGFRDHLCLCAQCYPKLIPHPQLLEEEETYEPPVSESGSEQGGPGSSARSVGTGSLLDRGEAALSTMDRVKAIEGVMVYNRVRDKVKDFLKPFADGGKVVSADDVKAYFEKLRGEDAAIREARAQHGGDGDQENGNGGQRREQSGY